MEEFDVGDIIDDNNDDDAGSYTVVSPSGSEIILLTEAEKDYYEGLSHRYQSDNLFKNISDLSELDRILLMETMCYRWGIWILREADYDGRIVDPTLLQKYIESYSKEIRGVKKDLGMDKASRDKDKQSSIADYIQNLRLAAKEFGVARNEQAIKAISILKELEGLLTLHDNSNDKEKREFKCSQEDIIEWIRTKIPEFDEIDEALRENQKLWIRKI